MLRSLEVFRVNMISLGVTEGEERARQLLTTLCHPGTTGL